MPNAICITDLMIAPNAPLADGYEAELAWVRGAWDAGATQALIARFASPEEAMQVVRINLLNINVTSPLAYASLTRGARADEELVPRCQIWAASHCHERSPVARMVALSALPERIFKRSFQLLTGFSPLEYIDKLRLAESKQMLESTDMAVEAIAEEVGYPVPVFRRLFMRYVALTPAQYRRRFGALGTQLGSLASGG